MYEVLLLPSWNIDLILYICPTSLLLYRKIQCPFFLKLTKYLYSTFTSHPYIMQLKFDKKKHSRVTPFIISCILPLNTRLLFLNHAKVNRHACINLTKLIMFWTVFPSFRESTFFLSRVEPVYPIVEVQTFKTFKTSYLDFPNFCPPQTIMPWI